MDSTEQSVRTPLTRDQIVDAALRLVDADGLSALSMRRLGADLGVEAMALYRHVNGREDLLEAMIEDVTARLELSEDMDLGPHGGWQTYLQWLAHTVREIAMEHPHVFPLIATRHPAAAWLRPPLRSLEVVEDFLAVLQRNGFSDDRAVTAYRTFTSFLIGQLLLDVSQRGGETVPEETLAVVGAELGTEVGSSDASLAGYPHILRLKAKLSEDRGEEEFEAALEAVLDRIETLVSQ